MDVMNVREEHLRIGDAERERSAVELGEHYAQGRITTAEHAERLDAVWAARTRAELAPIFADLPRPAVASAAALAPDRVRWRAGRPRLRFLPVLLVLMALAVVTHAPWLLVLPAVLFVLIRRARWSRQMR